MEATNAHSGTAATDVSTASAPENPSSAHETATAQSTLRSRAAYAGGFWLLSAGLHAALITFAISSFGLTTIEPVNVPHMNAEYEYATRTLNALYLPGAPSDEPDQSAAALNATQEPQQEPQQEAAAESNEQAALVPETVEPVPQQPEPAEPVQEPMAPPPETLPHVPEQPDPEPQFPAVTEPETAPTDEADLPDEQQVAAATEGQSLADNAQPETSSGGSSVPAQGSPSSSGSTTAEGAANNGRPPAGSAGTEDSGPPTAMINAHRVRLNRALRGRQTCPREARRQRLSGVAQVEIRQDTRGNVVSASLTNSSGSQVLDEAAISFARSIGRLPAPPDQVRPYGFRIPVVFDC